MVPEFTKNVPGRPCAVINWAAVAADAQPSSKVMLTTVCPGASTRGWVETDGSTGLAPGVTNGSAGAAGAAGGVRRVKPHPATDRPMTRTAANRTTPFTAAPSTRNGPECPQRPRG